MAAVGVPAYPTVAHSLRPTSFSRRLPVPNPTPALRTNALSVWQGAHAGQVCAIALGTTRP